MEIVKQWETEDYLFRMQEAQGLFFLHCDVYRCTPRVIRELYKTFYVDIVEYTKACGKEAIYTYSSNSKFVQMLAPDAKVIKSDLTKEVYIWELE
jgi:hypothetical protein